MEDKSDAEAASPLLPLIEDHAATGGVHRTGVDNGYW
jgi:hypothetical protein